MQEVSMLKVYYSPLNGLSGSACVYSLLEYAFRSEYGGAMPQIKKTPNGKPYFPERPEIHFSLSHARTHALCAVSDNPVGADIESPRQISKRAAAFFCSSGELGQFDPLDLWVLKESYIKLVGGTLVLMRKIRFSREGDSIISADNTTISKLYQANACRAAVSSIGEDPPASLELVSGSAILYLLSR